MFVSLSVITAFADDTAQSTEQSVPDVPTLASVSFKNAVINEEFSPLRYNYTLTLDNQNVSPTLKAYKIDGNANIFVNYILDDSKRQEGIKVTLEFSSGSAIYNFYYINAEVHNVNSNNTLSALKGNAVEVYPEMTEDNDDYTLYIPKDMTVLKLTAVTKDVSARCDIPSEIEIALDQEPTIPVTVTASDGQTRIYEFKVKRVNKTTAQVEKLMKSKNFKTLADDELFYKNPLFYTVLIAVICGIALVVLIVFAAKRIAVKPGDDDEESFFAN